MCVCVCGCGCGCAYDLVHTLVRGCTDWASCIQCPNLIRCIACTVCVPVVGSDLFFVYCIHMYVHATMPNLNPLKWALWGRRRGDLVAVLGPIGSI